MTEFKKLWDEGTEQELFAELAFCILTPQSRAGACWKALEKLLSSGVLFSGGWEEISRMLSGVRFHRTKARRIVAARRLFTRRGRIDIRGNLALLPDVAAQRRWLVEKVEGFGYKEASHFLRNIGWGDDLAILDRHVLKSLLAAGVVDKLPKALTPKRYVETENKMRAWAEHLGIPMAHLDFVLWFRQTGEVFK